MSIEQKIGRLQMEAQRLKGSAFSDAVDGPDADKYRESMKAIKDAISLIGKKTGEPSVGMSVDTDENLRITGIGLSIKIPF